MFTFISTRWKHNKCANICTLWSFTRHHNARRSIPACCILLLGDSTHSFELTVSVVKHQVYLRDMTVCCCSRSKRASYGVCVVVLLCTLKDMYIYSSAEYTFVWSNIAYVIYIFGQLNTLSLSTATISCWYFVELLLRGAFIFFYRQILYLNYYLTNRTRNGSKSCGWFLYEQI